MIQISFSDKVVTYETFVNDVAAKVVAALRRAEALPPYISQTKAFAMFGQGNVRRWREQGKIEPRIRPGKTEYEVSRLMELQNTVQDYF